jgi:hypothetical protein
MLAAWLRNAAQRFGSLDRLIAGGDVAQGENANQSLVMIDDRQAPDLEPCCA